MSLNSWDRALLGKYLSFYGDLAAGRRAPTTDAQSHFVRVFQNKAQPKTQHEIAYSRYLASRARTKSVPRQRPPALIADEVVEAVDDIDEAILSTQDPWLEKLFGRVRDAYQFGRSGLLGGVSESAIWLTAALAAPDVSARLSRWAGEHFNQLSNEVTKAMDGAFVEGLRAGSGVTPWNHRIFGGHTLPEAIDAARQALPDAGTSEIVWEALRALASDMSSASGLPVMTFSKEGYRLVVDTFDRIGLSEQAALDWITVNGVEFVGAAIPAVALMFCWGADERDRFAQMVGALGVSAIVSANPLLALIVLVAAALEFENLLRRNGGARANWAKAFASGGGLSGLVITSSLVIGGPVWVGLVAGIVASSLLRSQLNRDRFGKIIELAVEVIKNEVEPKSFWGRFQDEISKGFPQRIRRWRRGGYSRT